MGHNSTGSTKMIVMYNKIHEHHLIVYRFMSRFARKPWRKSSKSKVNMYTFTEATDPPAPFHTMGSKHKMYRTCEFQVGTTEMNTTLERPSAAQASAVKPESWNASEETRGGKGAAACGESKPLRTIMSATWKISSSLLSQFNHRNRSSEFSRNPTPTHPHPPTKEMMKWCLDVYRVHQVENTQFIPVEIQPQKSFFWSFTFTPKRDDGMMPIVSAKLKISSWLLSQFIHGKHSEFSCFSPKVAMTLPLWLTGS